MIVNEFESSKKYRLQQIMHTLESVHGVKLDFDSSSIAEIKSLAESCEIVKNSIVKESAFNTTVQNPEYTKNMLIIEAARIYLAEIAPKRMKKKAVKENIQVAEGPRGMGVASRDWALNKKSTDNRHGGGQPPKSFRQPGELSKEEARQQLKQMMQQYLGSGGNIKKVSEDDALKLQPGTLKVGKPGSNQEEIISANELANKQKQGFQPVAEDNDELNALYAKYGIAEAGTKMSGPMGYLPEGKKGKKPDFLDFDKDGNKKEPMKKALKDKKSMTEAKKKGAKPDFLDFDKDGNKKEPMKKALKDKKLNEAAHMETHDDYQADMARSELYRNTKYAMDMMKMIGPDDEVKSWISANLTKSAEILDKVYHYMDYYLTFDNPGQQNVMPVDEEVDRIEGDEGSIARQNLLMIMEYSTKLFRMIKPGDKLEGWVAMKLTTASEAISSSKHHMEYVQFQKHAGDMMGPEMMAGDAPVADVEPIKEASIANILMNVMLNEEQDLAQAETLLAAKAMSDDLQGIAEKLAKMSVDDLMPLVDVMKEQFGQDAANGFNDTIKSALQAVLDAATQAKDTTDNAVLAMQQGGVPGVQTDISTAGDLGDMDSGDEGIEADDDLGATPAAAGEPNEPLGRSKKSEKGVPDELEESWNTKMKTAKKDEGKWDGYSVAELKAKKKKLMDKESRSAAEQKEVKQINFALRAKSGWGKVNEGKDKDVNKAKKKAVIDPKQRIKDAKSKFDPRTDLKPGKKVAEGKSKKVTDLMVNKKKPLKEYAPPGKKAEEFIKQNKESFKNRYGKGWEKILYSTAWKKFGKKKESFNKAQKMLESAIEKRKLLKRALAEHRSSFKTLVNEGKVVDPLNNGYSVEGQLIVDQINETNNLISKIQGMIRAEVAAGVKDMMSSHNNNALAAKLAESKTRAPYGVLWKDTTGKKNEKFFESNDLRKYWVELNAKSLKEVKLVDPQHFDQRIQNLKAGK